MKQQVFHIVGEQGVGKTLLAHRLAKAIESEGLAVDVLEGDEIYKRVLYSCDPKLTHYTNLAVDVVIISHCASVKEPIARSGERVITLSFVK